jgi:cytochrome P450
MSAAVRALLSVTEQHSLLIACTCNVLCFSDLTCTTAARKEMCRLFGDVIAARRKAGAAAAESKTDMLQIFMDLKYKVNQRAISFSIVYIVSYMQQSAASKYS